MIKYIHFHYFVYFLIISKIVQTSIALDFAIYSCISRTLHDELKVVMPNLVKVLGQNDGAGFELEYKENK